MFNAVKFTPKNGRIKVRLEQGGDIYAIALSAYAGESDRQQALAAGYQLDLPKPIEPNRLMAAIHSFIRSCVQT